MEFDLSHYKGTTELSRKYSVSWFSIRHWLSTGELKGVKIVGRWRIDEATFVQFLTSKRAKNTRTQLVS